MSRPERLRLLDILDAMDRIASYAKGMSYEVFLADRKTQDAVTRHVQIIAEAAGESTNLSLMKAKTG